MSQSARHLLAAPADSDKGARGKRIELGRPRHRPLALAALVIAVAISLLLPVAGTVAVAALLTGLRAADRSRRHITARRISRGVRVTNPVLVAASMAWQLARAAVVTIMIAPLPLFIAGAVSAATIAGVSRRPLAAACAAGAFTALSCLGPWSQSPRSELHRGFNALAPTRSAAVAATLIVGVIAAAVAALAFFEAPSSFWPIPDPHRLLVYLPSALRSASPIQHWFLRLICRQHPTKTMLADAGPVSGRPMCSMTNGATSDQSGVRDLP